MADRHDANPALFDRRRKAIEKEMRQIQDDAEHWNRLHPGEPPIVIDMDLTADVERLKRSLCVAYVNGRACLKPMDDRVHHDYVGEIAGVVRHPFCPKNEPKP